MNSPALTIASATRVEIEVKRSRFLALAARAGNEEQAREIITAQRERYPDARHHCTAYTFTPTDSNPVERSNDDGEPAGTAGKPILEALRGTKLINTVVVVTRYFGGTLLGTGGLVRAYGGAAAEVLYQAKKVSLWTYPRYKVVLLPDVAARAHGLLEVAGAIICDTVWDAKATVTLAIAEADFAGVAMLLRDINSGPVELHPCGVEVVEKPVEI